MESEIFLTLLIKFCEPDKLAWQRAIAVEVLHKICWRPKQLRDICRQYDLEVNSIFFFENFFETFFCKIKDLKKILFLDYFV